MKKKELSPVGVKTLKKLKNPYLGHKVFSLSLNPNNACQFVDGMDSKVCKEMGMLNRLPRFRRWLVKYLKDAFAQSGIAYLFYIEVSTPFGSSCPDKHYIGSRLHCHGIIHLVNNVQLKQWLVEVYPKLLVNCRVDIDTISDMKIWKNYISKDSDWMREDVISSVIPDTFWAFTDRLYNTSGKNKELDT